MDLTPPSLTRSPYSPQRKSIDSPPPFIDPSYILEGSGSSFASLPAFDSTCNIGSPYEVLIDPCLTRADDAGSPFAPFDSIPSTLAWPTPDIGAVPSPPASTTSNIPVVTPEYDQFSSYGTPNSLSAACAAGGPYSRTASQSPAYLRTPPPASSDLPAQEARSTFAPTNTLSYAQEQLTSRPQVRNTSSRSSVPDGVQHSQISLAPSCLSQGGDCFNLRQQMYLSPDVQSQSQRRTPSISGSRSQFQHSSLADDDGTFQAAAPQLLPSSPLPEAHASNWTRFKKGKRRTTRRHTTKEEANFHCKVKGCGKFFSRSYNYKSHMETHDEKREYPFPCQVPDCEKKFVRKTDLQRHHQSVHAKERNHKCDYCGRLFARKDTLRRHMEDGCSKRFEVGMLEAPSQEYAFDSARATPEIKTHDLGSVESTSSVSMPLAPPHSLRSERRGHTSSPSFSSRSRAWH